MHNSLVEHLQWAIDTVKYELNIQLTEKITDLAIGNGNALQTHLDTVREYLDQEFDSRAPIADVENIDKALSSIDKAEETAGKAKEDNDVAEEAEERAQKTTIEEDTAMAENDSNNIIHKGGIKTVGAETNKDKNEKKGAEAKEEGCMAEEDGISIQKLDAEKDKAETGKASTTISNKSSRNDQSTKRLHRYTSQQPRAKATTTASITTSITTKYKHATSPQVAKLK